jgi:hypothetical protein
MEPISLQSIDWRWTKSEDKNGRDEVHGYCCTPEKSVDDKLAARSKTILVRVIDFLPFFPYELPNYIKGRKVTWTPNACLNVFNYIKETCKYCAPVSFVIYEKKNVHYYTNQENTYLELRFTKLDYIYKASSKLRDPIESPVGPIHGIPQEIQIDQIIKMLNKKPKRSACTIAHSSD